MDANAHLIEDWWMDWQAELAQDLSRVWVKLKFQKTAGYWIPVEGGRMLAKIDDNEPLPLNAVAEPNVWDHEHCQLCFQKISEYPGDQEEGYFDGKGWVRSQCYDKYIAPRRRPSV